jgi:hypothetical protein
MRSKYLLHVSFYGLLTLLLVIDASTFHALKSHAKVDTCAVDEPSIVTFARSHVDCIRRCASETFHSCYGVNYIGTLNKCEAYSYHVQQFASVKDCKHFRLVSITHAGRTRLQLISHLVLTSMIDRAYMPHGIYLKFNETAVSPL